MRGCENVSENKLFKYCINHGVEIISISNSNEESNYNFRVNGKNHLIVIPHGLFKEFRSYMTVDDIALKELKERVDDYGDDL